MFMKPNRETRTRTLGEIINEKMTEKKTEIQSQFSDGTELMKVNMSRWFLNSRLGWEILKFSPFNIELHFRFNKSFVRISTQRWARCTQRWVSCSPATGPARCPRPSRCFHRLPSLFIFKSCLFTWPRPAFRWRNPQFRNWEQLLYLTEPEKWSAAAMYQVIGYISQHLGLFCVTPCCDDLSRPELLMVLKCFKTGLISVLVIVLMSSILTIVQIVPSSGNSNLHIESQGEDGSEIFQSHPFA